MKNYIMAVIKKKYFRAGIDSKFIGDTFREMPA